MGQQFSKVSRRIGRSHHSSSGAASGPASGAASDSPSSDPSLPSGFRWQDGRGFKEEGNAAYPLPNDNDELMRLNAQHYLIRYVLEGNQRAPVQEELKRGIKVLDAGCGTGVWSMEMARIYPASQFIGTDITDIFTASIPNAPKNCHFEIADTLKGLPFEDGTFDYVFQRFHVPCFRRNEWPLAIQELIRVTKPGGWVELVDSQGIAFSIGPHTSEWFRQMLMMMSMRDVDMRWSSNFTRVFQECGLLDIMHDFRSLPVGWGPPEIAEPAGKNFLKVFVAFKPQMLIALGIDEEEYDKLVVETEAELAPFKTYWNIDFVYGRKPL